MTSGTDSLVETLFTEILRDAHRYARGLYPRRATLAESSEPAWRRLIGRGRERSRDLLERAAASAGFSRRHFDPEMAAERLRRVVQVSEALEETYSRLADEPSRRALIDLLKLRVLGPFHAPLPITPDAFRHEQERIEHQMRLERSTFEVSDPWFSPLSLYRVAVDGSEPITLHDHSVDIVSVFRLGQYSYSRGAAQVKAQPGDVVLDIGGCWGDTALYFASLVGPAGKVYTFEFDTENLEILRANLALNPGLADRIEVVELAMWDRSGETLAFSPAGRCTAVGEPAADGPTVATITLDDFVAQAGLDSLGFVKMDVEGAEANVLRGAHESIARFAPMLAIAAYHKDEDLIELPRRIVSLNADYRLYLGTFSAVEEETVLFANATARSSST